jgi:hypothetical protein
MSNPSGATGATGPAPPSGFNLADLLQSPQGRLGAEALDRALLSGLFTTPNNALETLLYAWVDAGSKAATPLTSVTLSPPATCSDGVVRAGSDYVHYLFGVSDALNTLNGRLSGVSLTYSVSGNVVCLNVLL